MYSTDSMVLILKAVSTGFQHMFFYITYNKNPKFVPASKSQLKQRTSERNPAANGMIWEAELRSRVRGMLSLEDSGGYFSARIMK